MVSAAITIVKFISTIATAGFAFNAIYGGTTNANGTLTRRGRRAVAGVSVSLVLTLAMLVLETTAERRRQADADRARLATISGLDALLSRAANLSDTLAHVGSVQAALRTDAARLILPLTSIVAEGRFVFDSRHPVLSRYASLVLRQAHRDLPGGVRPLVPDAVVYVGRGVVLFCRTGRSLIEIAGIDSVRIPFGSEWISRDSVPPRLDDFDFSISFTRGDSLGDRADLNIFYDVPPMTDTATRRIPGESFGYVMVDFVHRTVAQIFRTGRSKRTYSSGRITSVLDLANSNLRLSTVPVGLDAFGMSPDDSVLAFPVRTRELRFELEGGVGRAIRVPSQQFRRARGRGDPDRIPVLPGAMPEDFPLALVSYRVSIRDIETYPGELANLLSKPALASRP